MFQSATNLPNFFSFKKSTSFPDFISKKIISIDRILAFLQAFEHNFYVNDRAKWDLGRATSDITSAGLEKYLNSTLPIGQVTLKFCLPRGLLRLPQFSTSIIIYELKNGSQTTGVFQCNKPILTVVLLLLITFMSTDTKMSLRIKFCPSVSFMPCLPVEETKFAKLLLFVRALTSQLLY